MAPFSALRSQGKRKWALLCPRPMPRPLPQCEFALHTRLARGMAPGDTNNDGHFDAVVTTTDRSLTCTTRPLQLTTGSRST
jgi:hypothetical protein